MKKSLLALAVLGAFAGVASAQSSVTLYGTVDLNAKYVKNDGSARRVSLSQDGINSSQLGFRGVEDLGGGLKAGFVLLAGVNADTGSTNSQFFNRRATVSLMGGFGEVRLGRDYTPTFWNNTIFDAFGTNGIGDSSHVLQLPTATFVRANNSIGYFLPSGIGGVYGQFMVAAAEGASGPNPYGVVGGSVGANPGRYVGGRVGFAAGPFDIAVAYAQQRFNSGAPDQKTMNIGGSYDLGVAKLMGYFVRDEVGSLRENRFSVSGVVPLGQGEIHAGYDRSKLSGGVDNKVDQWKVGYVYNLSKRTAVYTNVGVVSNGNASRLGVAGGTAITAAPTFGGDSKGAEFGVRHFF
ncbi:MAG: porin [Pseudomonadota bacterium]